MSRLGSQVPLSRRFPAIRPAAIRAHQLRRLWRWHRDTASGRVTWATQQAAPLPVRTQRHASLLLRELGESEMWMQHNKVTNLRLASAHTDGLLIRPGETFSFNKVVGNCTRRKGYVDGMRLSEGEAIAGVGGGICQLANLIHWMVLHSPLTVVERSEHSFDPFPDNGRVLPWGVGCSIVWNYVDLVVRNDTDVTFQLRTGVGERHLEGELRASGELPVSYHVRAEGERFTRGEDDEIWRSNEIWRTLVDRHTGTPVADELVKVNRARVKYPVDAALVAEPAG
ncbi:VanW family protein [Nocardioides sp.]|uniref:VanW family protein n=1 Tax=Nocardioides sp. TaxID=35761 RepID=UPI002626F9EC|nr:VanW family protein [Nocardioides sp.]